MKYADPQISNNIIFKSAKLVSRFESFFNHFYENIQENNSDNLDNALIIGPLREQEFTIVFFKKIFHFSMSYDVIEGEVNAYFVASKITSSEFKAEHKIELARYNVDRSGIMIFNDSRIILNEFDDSVILANFLLLSN